MLKFIKIIFLITIIFFADSIKAQNDNGRKILREGIEASYSFQLEKANSLFENYIANFPQSPYGYHYISQLHLWYFLGSRSEAERAIYEKYSQIAQEKAEAIEGENDKNAEFHFLLGQIYTLRALNKIFLDERIGALFSSRSAMSEFDAAIEIDSTYYDAYYGIGLFNYVLSFIPSGIRWIISIAGMEADKEKGLENLRIVYEHGNVMKTEAAFHLAQIYADYAADYDSSLVLLNKLTEQYPNNIIFNYEKAVVLIKAQQLTAAEDLLLRFSSSNYKEFSQTKALIFFQLGNVNFLQNRFNEALIYYNNFFNTTSSLDFTGIAHYRMAICYNFLNEKLKSKHELLMAGQGNLDIEQDKFAKNQSLKLFDSWLTEENELLILAHNNLRACKFTRVIDSLNIFLDKYKNQELQYAARICIAEAFIRVDSLNSAFSNLLKIDADNIERKSWIIPYSELLFARYYFAVSDYKKADEFLELANENNEYDYEEEIAAKIINLKRKLTRHLKIDKN